MGPEDPRLAPFDYTLPSAQIARYPAARRDGARLLALGDEGLRDLEILNLPDLVEPGDLLVVNDTRVMPARLHARRETGGAVEMLFLDPGDASTGQVRSMVRPGRRLRVGENLKLDREPGSPQDGPVSIRLLERHEDGSWTLEVRPDPMAVMESHGVMPLPPYLDRLEETSDRERYQTIFANQLGAVAAPTAGLHLTEGLVDAFRARGAGVASITLHVGPGTFRNLRREDLVAESLHEEIFHVPEDTASAVEETRRKGGKVIAVGTTSTRALESAVTGEGIVTPGPGRTRLFIQPGYRFRVVGGLLTNFHLPCSSLLMLVCAFGGRERVMAAYAHAVNNGYRFYSYGDAMLLTPR